MARFSVYFGSQSPNILNPLNPLHYLLVLRWAYFQPTGLNQYLYQADEEVYSSVGLPALLHAMRLRAYRNLGIVALIASFLVAVWVALVISAMQGNQLAIDRVVVGVVAGVIYGVMMGGAMSRAGGTLVVGKTFVMGMMGGVMGGAVGGAVYGVASDVGISVAGRITVAVMAGLALGTAGSLLGNVPTILGSVKVLAALFVGIGGIVAITLGGFEAQSIVYWLAIMAGALRLVFYPFELIWVGIFPRFTGGSSHRLSWHPGIWDELTLLPAPGFSRALQESLTADFDGTLQMIMPILVSHPLRRRTVQRALSVWLAVLPDSLATLYRLIHILESYVRESPREWYFPFQDVGSTCTMLLGELAQVYFEPPHTRVGFWIWPVAHRFWYLTRTPVSRLAEVLYELARRGSEFELLYAPNIRMGDRFAIKYRAVRYLPHGLEIARSFDALAACLSCRTVVGIASCNRQFSWLSEVGDASMRPAVILACHILADISAQIAAAEQSIGSDVAPSIFDQVLNDLQKLAEYVSSQVLSPERILLLIVAQHWSTILVDAQRKLRRDVPIEDALSEQLEADLERQGLENDDLQIVLNRLYYDALEQELWLPDLQQGVGLTVERYVSLGGLRQILGDYLDAVLNELADEQQRQCARGILKSMLTRNKTRAVISRWDIMHNLLVNKFGLTESDLNEWLTYLCNKRIVRKIDADDRYEFAYDMLVEKIWAWISDEELHQLEAHEKLRRNIDRISAIVTLLIAGVVLILWLNNKQIISSAASAQQILVIACVLVASMLLGFVTVLAYKRRIGRFLENSQNEVKDDGNCDKT